MTDLVEKIARGIIASKDAAPNISPDILDKLWRNYAPEAMAALRAIDAAGYAVVPTKLTAENGMKYALIGEFKEHVELVDEHGNDHTVTVDVSWSTIKQIHDAVVAAAPDITGDGG